MIRANTGRHAIILLLVGLLVSALTAGGAFAAPDDGWMPDTPKTLSPQQKSMLTDLPLDSDNNPRFGDEAQAQYKWIECSKHRDFPGCKQYSDSEDSKNLQGVIYDKNGAYQGVWAAVPAALAGEHAKLATDDGVIDCAKANNKIPVCSKPDLMAPKPPVALKYDKASGEFVGFKQDDGSFKLPGDRAETTMCPGSDNSDNLVSQIAGCTVNALNPANVASDLLDNWFAQAAETVGKFAGDLLVLSMTWWLRTDSINVTSSGILAGERPVQVVVFMIIFLGIIGSATGMVMMRRAGPAAELAMGGFKFVLIASLSAVVVAGAVNAADDFAKEILTSGGTEAFGPQMRRMLGIEVIRNPGGVLVLGLIAAAGSLIQWVIGFARQAGLVILFALLIFAAAGQLSTWGRQWFPRIAAMMISLILYKPMAATIYKIGFSLMGSEESLSSVLVGIMTIILAFLALPTMLKFFDFAATNVSGGASLAGVGAGIGMGAAGLAMMGSGMSGPGGDAQSNYMNSTGPGTNGPGESDPSPGNTSPGGLGETGSSESSSSDAASQTSTSPEADLGSDGLGAASEASPGSGDGGESPGVPVGTGSGVDASGVGAEAGASGAMAANPYVAGAMAVKEGAEAVQGAADSMASDATGSDTGPGMP